MRKGTIPVEDRRLIIPESVYLDLEDMAAEKRKKADEFTKALITPLSLAQKILLVVTTNEKRGAGRKQG
jgi:hypothetical protein